jgi:hypothetical protein
MPRKKKWSAGKIAMVGGAGATVLGGVLLWRGWARFKKCREQAMATDPVCQIMNAPLTAGAIVAPLGITTFVVGGAVALIQGKGA